MFKQWLCKHKFIQVYRATPVGYTSGDDEGNVDLEKLVVYDTHAAYRYIGICSDCNKYFGSSISNGSVA